MAEFNPNPYIIQVSGKDYLPVPARLLWFRADHPRGQIDTEVLDVALPLVRAVIYDEDGHRLASAHAGAINNNIIKGRLIEKAETAAIGRALGAAGYGTQFAGDEFDDADNLSDSPQEPRKKAPSAAPNGHGGAPATTQGREDANAGNQPVEASGAIDWAEARMQTAVLFKGPEHQDNNFKKMARNGEFADCKTTADVFAAVQRNRERAGLLEQVFPLVDAVLSNALGKDASKQQRRDALGNAVNHLETRGILKLYGPTKLGPDYVADIVVANLEFMNLGELTTATA